MSAYGGKGTQLLGVSWSLTGLTTLIIVLRTYVRLFLQKKEYNRKSWDLWWAYGAWTLGIVGMSCISVAVHFGFGNHLEDVLQDGNVTGALLFQWIWATFSALMTAIAKFSVVAFLLSIQGRTHKYSRTIMYLLVGVGCMLNIATIFLIWFQCQPSSVLWDPAVRGKCPGNRASFYVGTISGAWGALADFYLAVFPVALVYSLKITKKLKTLLCFLMGLGAFTAVCSAVKTYELRKVRSLKGPTYDTVPLALWGIAESWVMLIASGIPAIWPLLKRWLDRSAAFRQNHGMPARTPNPANKVAAIGSLEAQMGKRMSSESIERWSNRMAGNIKQ